MKAISSMAVADSVAQYLLRRLERLAIHEVHDRAHAHGLLRRDPITNGTGEEIVVWNLLRDLPVTFCGLMAEDRKAVARLLSCRAPTTIDPSTDFSFESDAERPVSEPPSNASEAGSTRGAKPMASAEGRGGHPQHADRDHVLRVIRSLKARRHVADVAVALLLARAVGERLPDVERLLSVLRRPAPVIVVRAPVAEFEERLGKMLEKGLIMPFALSLIDAFGDRSLSGRYRDNVSDPHRAITISGKCVLSMTPKAVREALAKASLRKQLPIIIADETGADDFPKRLLVSADIVFETGGIDRSLLAELLHVCLDMPPKVSLAAMERCAFHPGTLGLDDLALAIRPGRSVEDILGVLAELGKATKAEDEDDTEGEGGGRARKIKQRSHVKPGSLSRKASYGSTALTQPEAPPSEKTTTSSTTRYLSVDLLAGYGQARDWALDLKADLALWREGRLGWSDMSTKLLLTGPPGTGKTTFAKALCNSLQIPLLATSLSTMLEPGYLGDVLKEMSSAFEAARDHTPAILFIDELDNIGKRSAGDDKNGEYWNSVVNRMLELLDGSNKTAGVIIVAATNYADRIDPALLRSGRLETRIDIPLPDTTALTSILEHHLGSDLVTVIGTRPRPGSASANSALDPDRGNAMKGLGPGRDVDAHERANFSDETAEPGGMV